MQRLIQVMVKATGQVRKVKMGRKQDTSASVSMDLTLVPRQVQAASYVP